jgi:hypothetical protein
VSSRSLIWAISSTAGKGIVSLQRVNTPDTSAKTNPDLQLEIAHLLLIDVVGYSKLLVKRPEAD